MRSLKSPGQGRQTDSPESKRSQDATSSAPGMDHHNSFPLSASVTIGRDAIPRGEGVRPPADLSLTLFMNDSG